MTWPEAFLYAVLSVLGSCCILPVLAYFVLYVLALAVGAFCKAKEPK